jgi:hypothetical protein
MEISAPYNKNPSTLAKKALKKNGKFLFIGDSLTTILLVTSEENHFSPGSAIKEAE